MVQLSGISEFFKGKAEAPIVRIIRILRTVNHCHSALSGTQCVVFVVLVCVNMQEEVTRIVSRPCGRKITIVTREISRKGIPNPRAIVAAHAFTVSQQSVQVGRISLGKTIGEIRIGRIALLGIGLRRKGICCAIRSFPRGSKHLLKSQHCVIFSRSAALPALSSWDCSTWDSLPRSCCRESEVPPQEDIAAINTHDIIVATIERKRIVPPISSMNAGVFVSSENRMEANPVQKIVGGGQIFRNSTRHLEALHCDGIPC